MRIRPHVVVLCSALVAGCSARPEDPTPAGHPAHAASAEAPLAPASETLALNGRSDTKPPATRPAGAAAAAQGYTCPHHPEVMSAEPGDCPKCGMKLTPKAPQPPATGPSGGGHSGHGGHR